jgi:excinuclease ABC subunit B
MRREPPDVPQIGAMFKGDFSRKSTLAEYGFRLPSCHRQPAAEIRGMGRHAPADGARLRHARPWELERTGGVFTEQVIRPTGLLDPPVEIRPVSTPQVDDLSWPR